ncbi:hypothetical protein N182_35030 [Sinorhizobium sp. GL2]|nr:hypothetical protein N182_35030 [Sinorhizobium sp. GL2]
MEVAALRAAAAGSPVKYQGMRIEKMVVGEPLDGALMPGTLARAFALIGAYFLPTCPSIFEAINRTKAAF